MSMTPLKLLCLVTKWAATLIAVAASVTAVLFLYDLVDHGHWGYPWWLLPVLIGTAAVAWLLQREASWMREQMLHEEGTGEDEDVVSSEM
jgi:hypothetical protein